MKLPSLCRINVCGLKVHRLKIFLFVIGLATLSSLAALAQTNNLTPSGPGKAEGSKSAPITVEVFSDFECPACQNFYETSFKQVIDNYVNTGKVYYIHRDFPLEMHHYSRQAARFANAAAALGLYANVEEALFDTQRQWTDNGKIEEAMAAYFNAAQMKKINDYETAHMTEINASIEKDRALGMQRNVNQTPSVFVTAHGKTEALPGGGVTYALMKQYLDYLLRQ